MILDLINTSTICDSFDGIMQKAWFTNSPSGEIYSDCDGKNFKMNFKKLYPGDKYNLWVQYISE